MNTAKSGVAPAHLVSFLGLTFHGTKIRLPKAVLAKFRRRVRELTGRSRWISCERRLTEPNRYLRGWMSYYGLSETKRIWSPLDHGFGDGYREWYGQSFVNA